MDFEDFDSPVPPLFAIVRVVSSVSKLATHEMWRIGSLQAGQVV
jgi:hypothetical protein